MLVQPTTQEIVSLFGDMRYLLVEKVAGYDLTLFMDGRSNWVPQTWWNHLQSRDPDMVKVLRLLDRGVNGSLHLNSSLVFTNFDGLWMCNYCNQIPFISTEYDEVNTHERECHPEHYDNVLANLFKLFHSNVGADVFD